MKTVAYYGYIIEHVIEVLLENRIVSSVLLFSNFLDYDLKALIGWYTYPKLFNYFDQI